MQQMWVIQIQATIFSKIFLPSSLLLFPYNTMKLFSVLFLSNKMGEASSLPPHPVHHSILCPEFLPDILYAVGKKFITCYDYSERAFSVAQLSTNAETTSSQEPLPAAYNVSAVPRPFFHSSDGIVVKFHDTGVRPDSV